MTLTLQNFKKFLSFVGRKAVFWLGVSFVSSIGLAIIELLISLFLQVFLLTIGVLKTPIDFMGVKFENFGLGHTLAGLIIIGTFRMIGQIFANHSSRFALDYTNARLKNLALYDLFYKVSGETQGTSDINYFISEIFPKTGDFLNNFTLFSCYFIQCFILLIILFFTTPKEGVLSLIGIGFIGFVVHKINQRVRKIGSIIPLEQKKLNAGIERVSKNILFVKITKTVELEKTRLTENIMNYCLKSTRAAFLGTVAGVFAPFLGILMLVTVIYASQRFFHTPSVKLLAFLYILVRFIQNLSMVTTYFGGLNLGFSQTKTAFHYHNKFSLNEKMIAMEPILKASYLGSNHDYIFDNSELKNKTNLEKFSSYPQTPSISFKNVTFSFENGRKYVLKDFSFEAKGGEQIGIIGPSGAGKSTFLFLILGFYTPQLGSVTIANQTPSQFFESNTCRVGYVGPEPYLIRGTIRENLCYGVNEFIAETDIWDALMHAKLDEFVSEVSLDYNIPEDQSGLSAGQKQRICLARAFLNKPQLLVLDEATSNLDEATEKDITESISTLKGQCTVLIVSHRPGALKNVDKTIKLTPPKDR